MKVQISISPEAKTWLRKAMEEQAPAIQEAVNRAVKECARNVLAPAGPVNRGTPR